MAAVKLNVMHWHLTEDQGFRVESKTYPRLHELGSDGMYYTREHICEVVSYAARQEDDRLVRILQPDMPTNIAIHPWRGREAMVTTAKDGYQSILSNGYYIDLMQPACDSCLNADLSYRSFSPYTLLPDVATGDARDARRFASLVDDFLQDGEESTLGESRGVCEKVELQVVDPLERLLMASGK